MKIFVIIGENQAVNNISARAAYSTREAAERHLQSKSAMWFDDRAVIVELELDKEVPLNANTAAPQAGETTAPVNAPPRCSKCGRLPAGRPYERGYFVVNPCVDCGVLVCNRCGYFCGSFSDAGSWHCPPCWRRLDRQLSRKEWCQP